MIALEGADGVSPYYDLDWLNRPDVHGGQIQAAFVSSQLAPQSPSQFRHETLWHYMQGGPGISKVICISIGLMVILTNSLPTLTLVYAQFI